MTESEIFQLVYEIVFSAMLFGLSVGLVLAFFAPKD